MIASWPGSERRKHVRRHIVKPATITVGNHEPVEVRSVDVSEGGVRFLAQESVDIGMQLHFSFHGEDARNAKVLGCIFLDEGYCIRCAFESA